MTCSARPTRVASRRSPADVSASARLLTRAGLALGLTLAGACGPRIPVATPAPVAGPVAAAPVPATLPTPVAAPQPEPVRHGYTAADVRFMQQMIHHHAQAVRMSALVPARSSREDVRTLAERIDASQQAEIEMMRHWLAERHEMVPDPSMPRSVHDSIMGATHGAHESMSGMPGMAGMPGAADAHDSTAMLMPGMLTPAEMAALAAATGPTFDRLFLEGMIRHHQGALTMVATLLATPGAAEEAQIFGFASDVDAGQRAEIRRMEAILATLPAAPPSQSH